MKAFATHLLLITAAISAAATFAHAERAVLTKEDAERMESRFSIGGPLPTTRLLYSFPDHHVVLSVLITREGDAYKAAGSVHIFERGLPAEGLAKWLNNQVSDALYRDAPQPVHTVRLADDACTITAAEFLANHHLPKFELDYKEYRLTLKVERQLIGDRFDLREFEDETGLHLLPPAR